MKSKLTRGLSLMRIVLAVSAGSGIPLFAQVTFDGSIGGVAGSVTGPNFQIPSNRGEIAGGNLFHSFSTFNLGLGQSATFTGPASVNNILARVTGGQSTIQGTVRSSIQGANLFLINPAGIVFGQGAQVDVTGAFRATTADFIELADGRRFSATPDGSVALLSAAPAAFGFLSGSGQAGVLRLEAPIPGAGQFVSGINGKGQDLALVGRTVEIQNSFLKSAGAMVSLVAAGNGAALVSLDASPREAPLDPSLTGNVMVTGSAVSVSGASGGEIIVRGGKIVIDGAGSGFVQNGAVFDSFSGIDADAKASGGGGEIRMEAAGEIVLRNNARVGSFSRNSMNGGTISFRAAGAMTLATGADVVASATAAGDGGLIRINAGSLLIDGTSATRATRLSAQSNSSATGAAGSIEVAVDGLLELKEGGSIVTNTFSRGAGGSIHISAGSLRAAQGSNGRYTGIASSTAVPVPTTVLSGYGDAGDVTVNVAGRIDLKDCATIESTSASDGNGGTVRVNAGSLFIQGAEQLGRTDRNEFLTGILGLATLRGTGLLGSGVIGGSGGDVHVDVAGGIQLVAGGQIDASSFGGGNSGNVTVSAASITADRAGSNFFTGIASDTEAWDDRAMPVSKWGVAGGDAGTVTISATDSITLLRGANISSSTAGSGDAGDVTVTAPRIDISGSGSDEVYTPGPESGIVALSEAGRTDDDGYVTPPATGNAGSVRVILAPGPGALTVTDGGKVSAESLGTGRGGSVTVEAGEGIVEVSDEGRISARSDLSGDAGQVKVMAATINVLRAGLVESLSTGSGHAGGVEIVVGQLTIDGGGVQSLNRGSGEAGSVAIVGNDLRILNRGEISVLAEEANAGSLNLEVSGDIAISGQSLITATAGGSGKGGDLLIKTGGGIHLSGSGIVASTLAGSSGDGGNVSVEAAGLRIENEGRISTSSLGSGNGGTIGVTVPEVTLLTGSGISSVSSGGGRAGSVTLDTGTLRVDGARISVNSELGDAGELSLNSSGNLRLVDSEISATAFGNGGDMRLGSGSLFYSTGSDLTAKANTNGGNITLEAPYIILNGGSINADAVDNQGGAVNISSIIYFANGVIPTADSENGTDGSVVIDAQVSFQSNEEGNEVEFLNPEDALQPDCTKRAAVATSTFVRAGRGGTRRLPGGYLPSFRIIE